MFSAPSAMALPAMRCPRTGRMNLLLEENHLYYLRIQPCYKPFLPNISSIIKDHIPTLQS